MSDLYNTIDPRDNDMSTLIGRGKSQRLVDMTGRSALGSGEDSVFRPRPMRLSGMVTTPAQSRQHQRELPTVLPPPYTKQNQSQIPMNAKPAIVSRMATRLSTEKKGLPWWAWTLIGVGGFVLVAVIVYAVSRSMKGRRRPLSAVPTLAGGASAAARHFHELTGSGYI
jgi:hypothetical protein